MMYFNEMLAISLPANFEAMSPSDQLTTVITQLILALVQVLVILGFLAAAAFTVAAIVTMVRVYRVHKQKEAMKRAFDKVKQRGSYEL